MKRLWLVLVLATVLSWCVTAPAGAGPLEQESPAVASADNPIPFKKEEAGAGESAGKAFAVLAVLLGLACAGLFAARRYLPQLSSTLKLPAKTGAKRRLTLVETMRLNPRTSLYLVQMDGRELLLAQSGDGVSVVVLDPANDSAHTRQGTQQ